MTKRPPDPLPEPGLVLADGTVLPGQEAVEAWQRAYVEHKLILDRENARYRTVCAGLRDRFGPARGAVMPSSRDTEAWRQLSFDDLGRYP